MPDNYSINSDNQLVAERNGERIVFDGNWKINSDYDLELWAKHTTLGPEQERLVLKGRIISAEQDSLTFELRAQKENGLDSFRILKLTGNWQADEANRITFVVAKKTSPDILTLQGAWQLNDNQQIVYTCEKTDLKTKTKFIQNIIFSGYWQISSADRLTYIFSAGASSRFDFKAQIESPNLYPKEGVIKYRIGAGIREGGKDKSKLISLYGAWKFSRALGLIFEMDHKNGRVSSLEFGAQVNFTKNNQVVFNLLAKNGESLGTSLTFTHNFLKNLDAELFLRLKNYQKESRIDAGIRIPW